MLLANKVFANKIWQKTHYLAPFGETIIFLLKRVVADGSDLSLLSSAYPQGCHFSFLRPRKMYKLSG